MIIKEYSEYNEAEILGLYSDVGWCAYTDHPEKLQQGFSNSLIILAAYDNDTLIGLIRAVGDGHTVVYIQDLLVHPAYQRRGVGACLTKSLLARFADIHQIFLTSDNIESSRAFYSSLGFREVTELGCCTFMKV